MNGAAPRRATGRLPAQAKINLLLHVLAREASGYHQIETLFQRLELADDVVVRTDVRGRSLECAGPALPTAGLGPVERNLAWRAALAYRDAAGWPSGFAIEVEKRIPVGGGLGGGSADAGAVLRVLDALAPRPLGPDALLRLAGRLGADVPFLTAAAPLAMAWGRGERLLALPPLPPRDVTLFCFDEGVPTADAYGWLAARRRDEAVAPALLAAAALGAWRTVAGLAANDFETVVPERHAGVGRVLPALRREAARLTAAEPPPIALLAGSGATLVWVGETAPGGDALGAATQDGVRLVRTRTASRVVPVHLLD